MYDFRQAEACYDLWVPEGKWIVLRLDGRGFSKMTEVMFEKPFDFGFHNSMFAVTQSVMDDFMACYAYTGSDEISLVLPPTSSLYHRRAQKLVSLSAGVASAEATTYMSTTVAFDSRLLALDTIDDVVEYLLWRRRDVLRCAMGTLCYWTLRQAGQTAHQASKAMHGQSMQQQEALLNAHSTSLYACPLWQQQGMGLFWKAYEKEGYNPITEQAVVAERRRIQVTDLPERDDGYAYWLLQLFEAIARAL